MTDFVRGNEFFDQQQQQTPKIPLDLGEDPMNSIIIKDVRIEEKPGFFDRQSFKNTDF